MPELDAMNPEMDPQQTAGTPDGGTDREGAMAKADLYKLANYSHKLFQQMHDDDQLEAWVQAKITKAADYIASVYHYLEYEMKFSEYGHHLDNSDTLSEGQKMRLKEVLAEAKNKMKDLKKTQAEKIKEEKSSTGGEITRSKGVTKHKENPNRYSDEEHGEVASNVKSKSAADKKKEAPALKKSPKSAKTWGMEGGNKFDNRDKEVDENIATNPDGTPYVTDIDPDEHNAETARLNRSGKPVEENTEPCDHCGGAGHVPKAPVKVHPDHAEKVAKYSKFKKAIKAIAGDKNGDGVLSQEEKAAMAEGKPSAGLSKEKKSAVVKDAKAGKDLGKPGKSFDKVAKSAGGGEKGKKIAAAAMWKNIKETTAYVAEKAEVEKKAKRDYDEDDKIETGAEEHAGSVDKAIKASKAKETVKESADMTRLRELTKHLLG